MIILAVVDDVLTLRFCKYRNYYPGATIACTEYFGGLKVDDEERNFDMVAITSTV